LLKRLSKKRGSHS